MIERIRKKKILLSVGVCCFIFTLGIIFLVLWNETWIYSRKDTSEKAKFSVITEYTDKNQDEIYNSSIWEEKGNIYLKDTAEVNYGGRPFQLGYMDDTTMSLTNQRIIEGKSPEKSGEMAVEKSMSVRLGIDDIKIGDSISLKVGKDKEEKKYVVTGFLNDISMEQYYTDYGEKYIYLLDVLLSSEEVKNNYSKKSLVLWDKENDLDEMIKVFDNNNLFEVYNVGMYPDLYHEWYATGDGEEAELVKGSDCYDYDEWTNAKKKITVVTIIYIVMISVLSVSFLRRSKESIQKLQDIGATKIQSLMYILKDSWIFWSIMSICAGIISVIIKRFIIGLIISCQNTEYDITFRMCPDNSSVIKICVLAFVLTIIVASLIVILSYLLDGRISSKIVKVRNKITRKVRINKRNPNYLRISLGMKIIAIICLAGAFVMIYRINCFRMYDYSVNVAEPDIRLLDGDNYENNSEEKIYSEIIDKYSDECEWILKIYNTNSKICYNKDKQSEYVENYGSCWNFSEDGDNICAYYEDTYVCNDNQINSLDDRVIEGIIDVDAINSGDEVILCMPTYYYIENTRCHINDYDEKKVPACAKKLCNSKFHAGDEIIINYGDDKNKKTTKVKIGAIIDFGEPLEILMTNSSFTKYINYSHLSDVDFKLKNKDSAKSICEDLEKYEKINVLDVVNFVHENQRDDKYLNSQVIAFCSGAILLIIIGISALCIGIRDSYYYNKKQIEIIRALGKTKRQMLISVFIELIVIWGIAVAGGIYYGLILVKDEFWAVYSGWFEWPIQIILAGVMFVLTIGIPLFESYVLVSRLKEKEL